MFFVKRGQVLVRKGGSLIATLKEGQYFGELALLTDRPRSTDVLALTDIILLALSRDDFEEVLELFPDSRFRIEAAAEALQPDEGACKAAVLTLGRLQPSALAHEERHLDDRRGARGKASRMAPRADFRINLIVPAEDAELCLAAGPVPCGFQVARTSELKPCARCTEPAQAQRLPFWLLRFERLKYLHPRARRRRHGFSRQCR